MSDLGPISSAKQTIAISGKNFLDFSKTLKVGDVIQGKVLSVLGNNKYGVHFRGHNVIAESTNKFETGQLIQGQIKDLGSKVIMRLVDKNTLVGILPKHKFLRSFNQLSVNPNLGTMFKNSFGLLQGLAGANTESSSLISQLLVILDPRQFKSTDGSKLNSFVRNLLSKKTMENLAGMISKLRDNIEQLELDSKQSSQLKLLLEGLTKNIEAQAQINKDINQAGMFAYLQVPFLMNNQMQNLELKVFDASSSDKDQGRVKINLEFDLKNLGLMVFSIDIEEDILDIRIFSERRELLALVDENSRSLLSGLSSLGFSPRSLNSFLFESVEAQKEGISSKLDFFSIRRIDTVA